MRRLPISGGFLVSGAVVLATLAAGSPALAQSAPYGWVDVADNGVIAGWARDDNINPAYSYFTPVCQTTTTGGIVVHAYVWPVNEAGSINGPLTVFGAMADGCRCDVGCHGFGIDLNGSLPPGRYFVAVYGLGVNDAYTPGPYGHPGNLDGYNAPLLGTPSYMDLRNQRLSFPATASSPAFVCDVFAESTRQVMTNDFYRVAYDFNVTKLSDSSYVSIFHADRLDYNGGGQCGGDSIAARYTSTPDGPFGTRTGNEDKIVTTTSGPSTYMWNDPFEPEGPCGDNVSGGANPIFFYTGSPGNENQWSLLWISVASVQPNVWRHFLHLGQAYNVGDLHHAPWAVLAENGGYPWATFSGAPVYRSYNPTPVRNLTDGSHLTSQMTSTNKDTNGLLGNVSRDASLTNAYYFYNDAEPYVGQCPPAYAFFGLCLKTMRRKLLTPEWANWFTDPVPVMWGWVNKVAYHPARGRWMVLHTCSAGGPCLQFSDGSDVESVRDTYHGGSLVPVYSGSELDNRRLGYQPETNSQWGLLKNAYGQVAGDDFRLYFRPGCEGCNYGGSQIRSLRVKCHP
jgi:hypothetical protein